MITKEPLDQPRYVVEQQFGSYNWYRTQWDVSAPVEQVPGLAYRVTGAYQNNGLVPQISERREVLYRAGHRLSADGLDGLHSRAQFQTQSNRVDTGLPPIGPNLPNIPLSGFPKRTQ